MNAVAGVVYAIDCRPTGWTYIGSTTDYRARAATHVTLLNRGAHPSRRLQESWLLYGASAFAWSILETVDGDRHALLAAEQRWLQAHLPHVFNGVRTWHIRRARRRAPVSRRTLPGLRIARERATMSQVELAAKSGVAQPTISKLEGGRSAHGATVRRLAVALNVQPGELMAGDIAVSGPRGTSLPREEVAS